MKKSKLRILAEELETYENAQNSIKEGHFKVPKKMEAAINKAVTDTLDRIIKLASKKTKV